MGKAQPKVSKVCSMCGDDAVIVALDLCAPCYSAGRYWQKKTLAEKLNRIDNLSKYQHRMTAFTGAGRHLTAVPKKAARKKPAPNK